jgi:hypothetical protein
MSITTAREEQRCTFWTSNSPSGSGTDYILSGVDAIRPDASLSRLRFPVFKGPILGPVWGT